MMPHQWSIQATEQRGYRSWKSQNLPTCLGDMATNNILLLNRLVSLYFIVLTFSTGFWIPKILISQSLKMY